MAELTFVDESTVKLISTHGEDDDVCHAAWVSNFGENHKKKPRNYEIHGDYVDNNNVEKYGYHISDEGKEWDKQTSGLINFLYRERHMSPFEHAHMKFYIETPIFVAREFMRHRTWSYNEMSSRYTQLPGRMFVTNDDRPIVQSGKIGAYKFEAGSDEQYGLVLSETTLAYQRAWKAYNKMLEAGIAREVARNVLPVGTMTQFYATANIRNVMQFLQLRNDDPALKEIRDVAIQIESHFEKKFPKVYAAYKAHDWRNDKSEIEVLRARVAELEAKDRLPQIFGGLLQYSLDDDRPLG